MAWDLLTLQEIAITVSKVYAYENKLEEASYRSRSHSFTGAPQRVSRICKTTKQDDKNV